MSQAAIEDQLDASQSENTNEGIRQSAVDPASVPLEEIDVADGELYATQTHLGYFERLRREDPVHFCDSKRIGPFWSVTRFDDIVYVEKNPEIFSSEPTIFLEDPPEDFPVSPGFIAMDGAKHIAQRNTVRPAVAPRNLKRLEPIIRERVNQILDGLPQGETFDWVDRVSIELTTGMLATLFDFPWEDRRKLTFWSDVAAASPEQLADMGMNEDDRRATGYEWLEAFTRLHKERAERPAGESLDFISLMAHGEATKDMPPLEYMGNLGLLIVGGNDTTRNSISGGVVALNENPAEYEKLRNDRSLIPNMVSEIIRWQTPLAHMRRTATRDTELGGKSIKKGDRLALWYVSGNRDESVIERANEFLIDRPNANKHLSFGWGVHYCVGSRVAEMQLRILWEETMERFRKVEVVGTPVRGHSNFVMGFSELPVRLHPW